MKTELTTSYTNFCVTFYQMQVKSGSFLMSDKEFVSDFTTMF